VLALLPNEPRSRRCGRSKAATIAVQVVPLGVGRGVMEIDRTVAGNPGARKAADDNDQLSAFRRANDELTFRDFLIGKAGECSDQSFLGLIPRL
jgi:hypothetical protein